MKESTKSTATMVATIIATAIAVWNQLSGANIGWVSYSTAFVLGFGFGYGARYFVNERRTRTAHNRLCRDILRKLSELPPKERGPWAVRESEKEKIDGKTDFVNAMESLIEQECVRGVDVRWHLDGKANVYTGPDFSVTGKRYVDD